MWEFCVKTSRQNGKFLEKLHQKLENDIKKVCGIETVVFFKQSCCLVMACKKEFQNQIKGKLKILLADIICKDFKFEFLQKNIESDFAETELQPIFLKVFTYFDLELERAVVIKSLLFPKTLNLESFFDFKLSFLKQKWLQLCHLANSNSQILEQNGNFLELLKFLMSTLDPKVPMLVFDFKANIAFCENKNVTTAVCKISPNTQSVLEVLVDNFSLNLKIISTPSSSKVQHLLTDVFDFNIEVF